MLKVLSQKSREPLHHERERIPLTVEDVVQATNLMVEYSLNYEDALHLAIALRNGAKEILSNDKDFDETPLKREFD